MSYNQTKSIRKYQTCWALKKKIKHIKINDCSNQQKTEHYFSKINKKKKKKNQKN